MAYKESLKSAWGYNDYNDWPIKYNAIMHLFLKEFAQDYLIDLKEIKEKGLEKEIKNIDLNPARLYRMINPVLYGMKKMQLPLAFQKEIALDLLDKVEKLKYGSIFNEEGKNIILAPEQINISNLISANLEESREVHKLIGLLWAYTEAIFFRAHDITKEIHGLYEIGENKLLIREYLNLIPDEIWSGVEFIPFKKIKVTTLYNKNIDLKIDSYNHIFLENGNFVKDLIAYEIEADGQVLFVNSLEQYLYLIQNAIKTIKKQVDMMNWKEKTKKYAEIIWYRKRPISLLAGRKGILPETVFRNIEFGDIDKRRMQLLTEKQIDILISTLI